MAGNSTTRITSICTPSWKQGCTFIPFHLQANRQMEAINKIIKDKLKTKFDAHKGVWVDELSHVLLVYLNHTKDWSRETLFSFAFGAEAVVPVDVGEPSLESDISSLTRMRNICT